MIEFLKLIRSLFLAITNYLYNNHISVLRKHYSRLAISVIKKQRLFIIVPVSIAFILSYPALYSLWNGGWTNNAFGYRTDLRFISNESYLPENIDTLEILQVWLKFESSNDLKLNEYKQNPLDIVSPEALNKDFLRKVWGFQNELFDGIIPNKDVFVHSPLQFWDNDLNLLENDNNLLKTINNKISKINSKKDIIVSEGLLGDVIKVNGLIKSAKFLRILLLSPKDSNYEQIWNKNLNNYVKNNNSTDFEIVNYQPLRDNNKILNHFTLKLSKLNSIDHFILTLSYSLIALYFIVSLFNLKSVRSKLGLLLAFVVQIVLSILSSATLTSYFFHGVVFDDIPLQFLPFIVIVVSIENTFRLVSSISKTGKELSIQHKLSDALTESGLTSTLIIITDFLLFTLIYSRVSKSTREFLFFVSFALLIDHLLHLTYFTSILSIDLHRLELSDLLNEQIDDDDDDSDDHLSWSKKNNSLEDYNDSNDDDNQILKFLKRGKDLYYKIQLPFSSTVWGTTVVSITLIVMNFRWSNDSISLFQKSNKDYSLDIESTLVELNDFLKRNILTEEILSLVKSSTEKILLELPLPSLFIPKESKSIINEIDFPNHFNTHISYTFDIYYILEFLTLLTFILSVASLILTYFTKNLTVDEDKLHGKFGTNEDSFQVRLLSGSHLLDIIKISTSNSPFIASVGLDHKVLIWSPVSKPLPKPTQLPISPQIWPIINVVISDSGNFITIFSKSGVVQCWSRVLMTWVWKFEIPEMKGDQPLESFFRYKTIPAFLQRKRAAANRLISPTDELITRSRRNSLRSISSPKLNPTNAFNNNLGLDSNHSEDFIVVLKTGILLTISCQDQDNTISREKLHNSNLVLSSKLITPRVNDRLVSFTNEGNLLVSTAVNNKWKSRTVTISQNSFNNPNQFISGGRAPVIPESKVLSDAEISKIQIAIVPFVGFMVKTNGQFAELIDVQTGIVIKKFKIDPLIKQKSLKVFHDQPTHCRFCGSVSIASFSIAYSLKTTNSLVMHTFKVDHRAKTSICLRVERDPREIRCVGFNQVNEHIYHVDDIEGWSCTDQNEIMGLKRKSESEIIESVEKYKTDSVLRHRHSKSTNQNHRQKHDSSSNLYNLWEGWKITADGKFEILKIPDIGNSDGLLVNSIGEINKFGHKSIVVVLGNIMKILYLGNDELIYNHDGQKVNSSNTNEEINGLSFINKRRLQNKNRQNERYGGAPFGEFENSTPSLSELVI